MSDSQSQFVDFECDTQTLPLSGDVEGLELTVPAAWEEQSQAYVSDSDEHEEVQKKRDELEKKIDGKDESGKVEARVKVPIMSLKSCDGLVAGAPCQPGAKVPKKLMSAAELREAKRRKLVSYPRGMKDDGDDATGEAREDDSPPLDDLIK